MRTDLGYTVGHNALDMGAIEHRTPDRASHTLIGATKPRSKGWSQRCLV